jgi:hypothetical protein
LDTINAKLVAGTVIGDVNLGAVDNAVLDSIVTATAATQAAVEGTLTVAAHAVTNVGTFATQVDGAALTSLQLIDNIVQVEDVSHSTGASGVMSLVVRNDTLAALAGTDGDYSPLQVDASGALYARISSSVALNVSAATVTVDGSGVTQPISGTVTANLSATDNAVLDTIDAAIDAMSAKFTSGTVIGDVNLGATDNAVLDAIAASLAGTLTVTGGGGGTEFAEDVQHTTGDLGSMSLAVRNDTLAALAGTDGDYTPFQVNAAGALYIDGSDHTQPVSGTVTANLSATDNAVLDTIDAAIDAMSAKFASGTIIGDVNLSATDNAVLDTIASNTGAIKTAVEILDNAISGSEMQVDIVSSATLTVAAHAVTNAGTFVTQIDGAALTSLQLLDDAISGNEMQVDIVTIPTITVNAHAVTNAGTFAVQVDGAALTALQLIDNIVSVEDAVHSSGNSGVMALGVRQDSQSDFGADGDYVPFSVDANGALRVVTAGGSGSTQYVEDTSHNTGDTGTMTLGVRNDSLAALGGTDGDYVPFQMNAAGALYVDGSDHTQPVSGTITANLSATDNAVLDTIDAAIDAMSAKFASGTVIGDVNLGATDNAVLDAIAASVAGTLTVATHAVTNAGTFATQVDGAALTALQLIDNIVQVEDVSHSTGASGVMALAVRNDTLAALAGTDGDYAPLQVDATGALFVQVASSAALDVSAATVTVDGSGVTQPVSGTVTANLSATDNAVLDTIDSVLDTINAKLATGTVIGDVNLGATDNAVLDDIAAQVTTIAAAVSTQMQVDVVASLPAGAAAIGKLAANSGVDIGDVDVTSISAGSNLVGDVGLSGARTSGGSTPYKNLDVDESEDAIKASAGQVYWMHAMNMSAVPLFLKFYNATVGSVTVGTTVPDLTFPVPTLATTNGAGFTIPIPNGIAFGTAITIACTTGFADNDAGAPATNAMIVNAGFG